MFVQTVQELASQKGITIAKMIKDLGLGQGTFSTWKKRGTIPNGDTLRAIANYFGVSVDYLLGNTDEKKKPTADGGEPLQTDDPLLQEAIAIMEKLSPNKQEQAFQFLQFLAKDSQHNH